MMLSTISRALNLKYRLSRYDLKVEIEKLARKLKRIQVTIEELEHRENLDETVKLWLQELECLASDAEDVLDVYNYELLREKLEVKLDVKAPVSSNVDRMFYNSDPRITMVNCSSPCFSNYIIVEIIEGIKQINSRFEEISIDRKSLQITNEEGKRRDCPNSTKLSATSHLINTDGIFGRIGDKQKIIDFLLSGVLWDEERNDQLRVIPILGMGGIGKTTLAQMVYDDPFVQSMFDVMAWVYVSPEYNIINLTKDISEIVTGNAGNSFNGFSKIQEVLQKELMGKAVLLVLDDVWNVEPNDWETLFLPLRVSKLVRVLVTSRNDAVVQDLRTVTSPQLSVTPHWLNVLSEDECRKLLYYCAFGSENMNEICSGDIGCQIIKKCGRLPLAIKCIGGVLHNNDSKDRWMEILDSEFWESDEFEPVFQALLVSYYHLPRKLRACLLFCSLFPKGSRLRKFSIVYMWMAHGFLQPIGRYRAEDLGEDYLDELQMRSFIVPCTKGSFCLHDAIYDLARSLSAGKIHTIKDEMSNHVPDNIQHLYIKNGYDPTHRFGPCRLRTLFNTSTLNIHGYFTDFHDIRSVHVLGLIGSNVFTLTSIPLKHLRYLAIKEFGGGTLPESLCFLYHLQTLKITHCCNLRGFPINIANLVHLRYLHIAHVGIEELPLTLWQVPNLQMLCLKECCNFRVLPHGISKLVNLHILILKSCKQLKELPADIGHLVNLTHLDLSFSGIRTLPASVRLLKSTRFMVFGLSFGVRKQLNPDLEIPSNLSTGGCNLKQKQKKWRQKLIIFGSQQWQRKRDDNPAMVVEDNGSVSRNTWMTSRGSTAEILSHFSSDTMPSGSKNYDKQPSDSVHAREMLCQQQSI